MGPSVPKICRDDFFTGMGPSVPEILRGDFSPKLRVTFSPKWDLLFLGPSVPEILIGGDFLYPVAWDHLCPKRKILPGSNYYCGEVILPTCCLFSPVPHLFAFVYTFLFDLSFFACLSVLLVFFFRCVPARDLVRILCCIS